MISLHGDDTMAPKGAKNAPDTRLHAVWAVAALAATMSGVGAAERQFTQRPTMPTEIQQQLGRERIVEPVNARLLTERVSRLQRARDVLHDQAVTPVPRELPTAERAEARRYQGWLKKSAFQLDELARRGEALIRPEMGASSMAALDRMQEMNRSFSLQYLAIQQKLQHESREFNLLSNVMKTRHDAAKDAINNLR